MKATPLATALLAKMKMRVWVRLLSALATPSEEEEQVEWAVVS